MRQSYYISCACRFRGRRIPYNLHLRFGCFPHRNAKCPAPFPCQLVPLTRGARVPLPGKLSAFFNAGSLFTEGGEVILRVPVAMLRGAAGPIDCSFKVSRVAIALQVEIAHLTFRERIAPLRKLQVSQKAQFILSRAPIALDQLVAARELLTGLRVYLKTPNAPGQRVFLRCAASFFLEIRQYSCEKMSCAT